jgi:hypothetical protein
MSDDSFVVRKGLFKGKRVELASTTGIRRQKRSPKTLCTLFGFDPGQNLITDLSSLHDFVGVDDMEVEFFNMIGNTVGVVTVAASAVRLPTPTNRPTVRGLTA